MRSTKIFIILAVAATALTAFAASASASIVTTTTGGTASGSTIHLVTENGHASLANSNANIACPITITGTPVAWGHRFNPPPTSTFVDIRVDEFIVTLCTNGWTVEVNAKGNLLLDWTSGHNGTLRSSGATLTAVLHTIFGDITCRYSTNNTHIGTVTGGNPATLKLEGKIPFHSGGGLCGSGESQLSGNLVTTSALYVAP
jgi:hypothetical protein